MENKSLNQQKILGMWARPTTSTIYKTSYHPGIYKLGKLLQLLREKLIVERHEKIIEMNNALIGRAVMSVEFDKDAQAQLHFKVITYMIINEINTRRTGYKDDIIQINALHFADDGLLLANSTEDAKNNLKLVI